MVGTATVEAGAALPAAKGSNTPWDDALALCSTLPNAAHGSAAALPAVAALGGDGDAAGAVVVVGLEPKASHDPAAATGGDAWGAVKSGDGDGDSTPTEPRLLPRARRRVFVVAAAGGASGAGVGSTAGGGDDDGAEAANGS